MNPPLLLLECNIQSHSLLVLYYNVNTLYIGIHWNSNIQRMNNFTIRARLILLCKEFKSAFLGIIFFKSNTISY